MLRLPPMAQFGRARGWGRTGREEELMWPLVLKDGDLLAICVLSWRVQRGEGRDERNARDIALGAAEDEKADILRQCLSWGDLRTGRLDNLKGRRPAVV